MTDTFIMLRYFKGEVNVFRVDLENPHHRNHVPVEYSYGADIIMRVNSEGEGVVLRRRAMNNPEPGYSKMFYDKDEVTMLLLQAIHISTAKELEQ